MQVREVVYDFYGSNYASCLSRLQRMLPVLRLDMHLSSHLEALYASVGPCCWERNRADDPLTLFCVLLLQNASLTTNTRALYSVMQVRSKGLIQYTAPFVSVNLNTMADAFGTNAG
jgi:COP9 signalosome complex subunit 1